MQKIVVALILLFASHTIFSIIKWSNKSLQERGFGLFPQLLVTLMWYAVAGILLYIIPC